MKASVLDDIEVITLATGALTLSSVLGIVCLVVSTLAGILNLIIKVKVMLKDGKIDENELQELVDDAENLVAKISERKRN